MLGSPPPPRGILYSGLKKEVRQRFTPASAGNTSPVGFLYRCSQGSPPPPRGIHIYCSFYRNKVRFTPASAGNTNMFRNRQFLYRVHPRLRGEYSNICAEVVTPIGSPPPPRGIQFNIFMNGTHHRFTPASAGNTLTFVRKLLLQ